MVEFLTTWMILIFNPIAAILLIGVTVGHQHLRRAPVLFRLGTLITACGLIVQVTRTMGFALTGESLLSMDLPFWALKDLGIIILVLHYTLIGVRLRNGG